MIHYSTGLYTTQDQQSKVQVVNKWIREHKQASQEEEGESGDQGEVSIEKLPSGGKRAQRQVGASVIFILGSIFIIPYWPLRDNFVNLM